MPIDTTEPFDIAERYRYLHGFQLAAVGATDKFDVPGDIGEPIVAILKEHRGQLDWNLLFESWNSDWNDNLQIQRMPPGPPRDAAAKALHTRLQKERDAVIDPSTLLEPRPHETWQAYSLRLKPVLFAPPPVIDSSATRQDQATATWEKLHALLVAQSQSR
jgi:hypothetical protein